MNFKAIADILSGLKNYSKPVVANFRPANKIISESFFISSRPWKGIVLHHSATKDGTTNDWAGIRKYHMSYRIDGDIVNEETFKQRQMLGSGKSFEKPWSDIGYHGGWELEGSIYVFKIGRPWSVAGAHAGLKNNNSYNSDYLGLCAVGNFDSIAPASALWQLCLETVREIRQHFGIDLYSILGHREVYDKVGVPRAKTCPGNFWDMEKFRREL